MTTPAPEEAARLRILTASLVSLLAAVAAIPISALWVAFGPKAATAPDFTLTDQNDRPFTLSAQRGHPVVLFFGWAHCPDECPTALATLARAVHSQGVPSDVRVAFITVDPERDTPAALKRYVGLFDASFTGLTGNLTRLTPVYSAYHTFRRVVPAERGVSGYSMEHRTTIYYIGRNGVLGGYGKWDDPTPAIADDLRRYQ